MKMKQLMELEYEYSNPDIFFTYSNFLKYLQWNIDMDTLKRIL